MSHHFKPSLYIFVVLGVLLWGLSCCQKKEKNYPEKLYAIAPPLKGVKIVPKEKTIDPTKVQVVRFEGGTQLEVPANAFVDEQGKPVTTPVKLALEVYDTKAKILASGIPMTYNDGKTKGYFESAGMFQINGTSEDKKVNIAQDKALIINYPSKVAGDDFDFFYFEEVSDQSEQGNTVAMAQIGGKKTIPNPQKARKGHWKKLTNKPQINTQNKPKSVESFRLNFKKDSFPELADLETIDWQLATKFKNPKDSVYQWVLKEKWADLELSKPKYILGNPLKKIQTQANNNYPYKYWDASRKGKRFFLVNSRLLYIYNEKGGLVKIIAAAHKQHVHFRLYQDKYLIIWKQDGVHLYDFDGKQIGVYKEANDFTEDDLSLSLKNNRVAFRVWDDDPVEDGYIIKLTDLSGKVIKTLKLTLERDPDQEIRLLPHFKLVEGGYLVTNDITGVKVYNLNGELVVQKSKKFKHFDHFEGSTIFLYEFSGQLRKWDFIKNQELLSPKQAFNLKDDIKGNVWRYRAVKQKIHQHPVLVIEDRNIDWQCQLWNYQTNQVTRLPVVARGNMLERFRRDTIAPHLVAGYNGEAGILLSLYDINQKKIIAKVPGYHYPYNDLVVPWQANPYKNVKLKRVLLNSEGIAQMRDFEGKVIFDFKKYDSTSFYIGFTKDDYIFSISKTGVYRKWDTNGNLMNSKTWENGRFSTVNLRHKDLMGTFSREKRNFKLYDLEGNFILHPSHDAHYQFEGTNYWIEVKYQQDTRFQFFKMQERPKQAYQLTVRTLKKEFITYVYAYDPRTQQILAKYRQFRARKLAEETGRQHQESALVRTFKIKKFGLYNWDILLFVKDRVTFEADFDFQQATDYNDVVVFLITNARGRVVIPFVTETWNQFSVDPQALNRLVAVLPNNKLAVFSQAEMDKIDWQKIKQTGKYKFKMRVLPNTVENMEALTEVLQ